MFFDLMPENAQTLLCKKVAIKNGDIREAFDILKTALSEA